jgi:hypothetical protein
MLYERCAALSLQKKRTIIGRKWQEIIGVGEMRTQGKGKNIYREGAKYARTSKAKGILP